MEIDLFSFGDPLPDLNPGHLNYAISRKVLSLCAASKDFEVVQLGRLLRNDKTWDLIIVDCVNDQVASRNAVGIKVRERLALIFEPEVLPEVRALRKDFPLVPHLNHVPANEPFSLCLYFEPWSTLKRTWTPQKHLQRILWWLTETSKEKLHRDDQPPEPLYFDSPFQIVLPLDFEEKMDNPDLVLMPIPIPITEQPCIDFKVIRGVFQNKTHIKTRGPEKKNVLSVPIIGPGFGRYDFRGGLFAPIVQPEKTQALHYELLAVKISPIVHGVIEQHPNTLGQLHDQIERRGESILVKLKDAIKERARGGISRNALNRCLLMLWVPMKGSNESKTERRNRYAFELKTDLTNLGEVTGTLQRNHDEKFYPIALLDAANEDQAERWRQVEVFPITVSTELDKDFARVASGINIHTSDFKGVLAGVGALGSTLAELWAKEHWGEWSLIDPDFIKPHNIIRHIAKDVHVGCFKADVVKCMMEANYAPDYYHTIALSKHANDLDADEVKNAILTADFFVDATTTIEVPRDLSQRDDVPRSVSVFLTPSGRCSVLLIEPADRSLRLDALEAQYYRGIIASEWGAEHLNTNEGSLRVGSGCRDVSVIMSSEAIELHAALLARQIRLLRDRPESHIRVWSADFETGALTTHEVPVDPSGRFSCGDWQVILDRGIQKKLYELRKIRLPNETGGVILGYIDHKLSHIYIVDVLQAPPDSDGGQTGFTRGVEGLKAVLDEVARRTASIVGYLGEWHSHPAFTSPYPSPLDRALIEQLSHTLSLEGQPALMVIIGSSGDVSLSVKEG